MQLYSIMHRVKASFKIKSICYNNFKLLHIRVRVQCCHLLELKRNLQQTMEIVSKQVHATF